MSAKNSCLSDYRKKIQHWLYSENFNFIHSQKSLPTLQLKSDSILKYLLKGSLAPLFLKIVQIHKKLRDTSLLETVYYGQVYVMAASS